MSPSYVIAQITDLHLTSQPDSNSERLARAVDHINNLNPNYVIASGDLVDDGEDLEAYTHLKDHLDLLESPYAVIPGNHDTRTNLREAFGLRSTGYTIDYIIDDAAMPLTIIALDSTVPGKAYGQVQPDQMSWLDSRLKESQKPALLFLHHPPLDASALKTVLIPEASKEARDALQFKNVDLLTATIAEHPRIKTVSCGHLHLGATFACAHAKLVICPSIAPPFQVLLDQAERNQDLGLTLQYEPGITLHAWHEETQTIVSGHVFVGGEANS